MDTFFFNITSDVLSYAYQLLFYITLPCKHSSILIVLLSVYDVPFSSIIQHSRNRRQTGRSPHSVLYWTKWKHSWIICSSVGLVETLAWSLVVSVVE